MVIQCPECTTRFKLSDEKIKPEGVKVRCAKCRHIFTVVPEAAPEITPAPVEPPVTEPAASTFAAEPAAGSRPVDAETAPSATDDLWDSGFGESDLDAVPGEHQPTAAANKISSTDDDWDLGFTETQGPSIRREMQMPAAPDETATPLASESDWADLLESEPALERQPATTVEAMEPSAAAEAWGASLDEEDLDLSLADEGSPVAATTEESPAGAEEWNVGIDESNLGLSSLDDIPVETVRPGTEFLPDDQWGEEPAPEPAQAPAEEESAPTDLGWGEGPGKEISGDAFGFENETIGAESDDEFEFEEDSESGENLPAPAGDDLSLDEFSFEEETPEGTGQDLPGFSFDETVTDEFSFERDSGDGADAFAFDESNLFASDDQTASDSEETAEIRFDLPPSKAAASDNFGFDGISFGESETVGPAAVESQETIAPVERSKPVKKPASFPDPLAELAIGLPTPAKQKRKTPMSSVLRIFLVLLLVLGTIAGYLLWRGGTTDILQIIDQLRGNQEPSVPAAQIRLPLPNSFFIMNQEVGQLFVVQGDAVNGYSENRSAIAVKGMLHDDQGNVLMQQTVFCGNLLSYEDLQTASFAKIEEAMNNQFGNALSNLNVGPGKEISYMIVFRALPTNVTEFTVEVVDSKPGGQH